MESGFLKICLLGTVFLLETACEATRNITEIHQDLTEDTLRLICQGPEVATSAHRNECCSFVVDNFRKEWHAGGYYLTEYLATLRDWNCQAFKEECDNPVYKFTAFTRLVYDNFCSRNALLAKCAQKLHNIAKKYNFSAKEATYGYNHALLLSETIWKNVTSSLKPDEMLLDDLIEPCVAVALYDRPAGGEGRFHEVVQPFTLFCEITWLGYDIDTSMKYQVAAWTSWSVRCRASVVICMVVAGALGISIMIANTFVFSVYLTTPKLRNSQAIFKTSIAIGDFIAGMVVLPNMIGFQYLSFIAPHTMGDLIEKNGTDLPHREPGGSFSTIVPRGYISFVGFFTTLSLFISIYTLLIASFDRFWAVFRPLRYSKMKAKLSSKIGSAIVWGLGIFFASIPIVWERMRYSLIVSSMATTGGYEAMILVAIAFGIPIVVLCIVNIGTYRSAKKHAKIRQRLKSDAAFAKAEESMERKLSRILGLMVGVFTFCFFPIFFLTVLVMFMDHLLFSLPQRLDASAVVIYHSAMYCAILLFLSNSLWNCLIYSSRGEDFRRELKRLRALRYIRRRANYFGSFLKRLSVIPQSYYRRKSSAGSSFGALTNTEPSNTTRLPTSNPSSEYLNMSDNVQTYGRKASDPAARNVYISTILRADDINREDYGTNDSTFGSFAIEGVADRLFESVMEHIDEEK